MKYPPRLQPKTPQLALSQKSGILPPSDFRENLKMARRCRISGKQGQAGHRVSHAKNRTKHLFKPNLQSRKIFVPEAGKYVKVKVSTRIMRTIDKIGLPNTLKKYGMKISDLLC